MPLRTPEEMEQNHIPVFEITWTDCDTAIAAAAAKVIVDEEGYYNITTGKQLHDLASYREIEQRTMSHLEWTPYTTEKWKELNK